MLELRNIRARPIGSAAIFAVSAAPAIAQEAGTSSANLEQVETETELDTALPTDEVFPHYLADYEYSAYDMPAANAEVNRRLAEHITRPIPFPGKGGHTWYAMALGPELSGKHP